MITYLEFLDWSLLLAYFSARSQKNLVQILKNPQLLPMRRERISDWNELNRVFSEQESFFDDDQTFEWFLIDIQSLPVTTEIITFLETISQQTSKLIFLYSSEESLGSDVKKLWKKKFNYEILKMESGQEALSFAKDYAVSLGLERVIGTVSPLIEKAEHYAEIIDILDLIQLADNPNEMVKNLSVATELPLFMTSFTVAQRERDARNWFSKVSEEEVQLALSLLYTKLEKQSDARALTIRKEIIGTDQRIKTRGGIDPQVWWKLLLWKSAYS